MKNKPWLPWLSAWFIINLVQAYFTELWHDEAHYWMFSQHLDWGYWDHPPMTPLFVKLGYDLFPNELGVRFFIVLINTLTIYFLYKMVSPQRVKLFFMMVFGTAIVHVGWMAAPDLSLLFFTSAFLFVYQKYAAQDKWGTAILLGFLVAGMAYSKYHGALVLLFALIGNLKLLRRPSFYSIPVLAAVLFLPHLSWQYEHGFPTFIYHLIDRGTDVYEWKFISDYILGQLLVFGPFLSFAMLPFAWKYKTQNDFERSLKWILFGILAFFFYQSFSQRTEANWTATVFLPLIYLAYKFVENKEEKHRLIYRLAIPTLVLVGIFRLYLMWDFLPPNTNPRNEFHDWDKWAQDISDVAGNHPVVFYNGYKDASKYRFYAQKPSVAISVHNHAGTQYELMYDEAAKLQGDTVVSVSGYTKDNRFNPGGFGETGWRYMPNFRSYNSIRVELAGDCPDFLTTDTTITIPIKITNPTDYDYDFRGNPEHLAVLQYHFYVYEKVVLWGNARPEFPQRIIKAGETIETTATVRTPNEPGDYRWRFDIDVTGYHNSRNMSYCNIRVE